MTQKKKPPKQNHGFCQHGFKCLTLDEENWIRAFPFTSVAAICKITDSRLYALLQPCKPQNEELNLNMICAESFFPCPLQGEINK